LHREEHNLKDKHAIRVDYCSNTNHQPSSQDNKKKTLGYITAEQVGLLSPWIDRELVVIVNNNDDVTNKASRRSCCLVSSSSSDTCIELVVTVRACREAQKMLEAV
jgi:hypothetical protein